MPGKRLNYQKLVRDASNLASFYCSYIDGIVCVKQIGLGSARTLTLFLLAPGGISKYEYYMTTAGRNSVNEILKFY